MINLLEKYHCQIPIIQVVSVMEKTALKFRVGNLLVVIVAPSKKKKKKTKRMIGLVVLSFPLIL